MIISILTLQVHPNAERPAHLRLKMYEFAGRIVGKCLYESALGGAYKQLVRARFTRSFLAQIIGLRMNYKVWDTAHSYTNYVSSGGCKVMILVFTLCCQPAPLITLNSLHKAKSSESFLGIIWVRETQPARFALYPTSFDFKAER